MDPAPWGWTQMQTCNDETEGQRTIMVNTPWKQHFPGPAPFLRQGSSPTEAGVFSLPQPTFPGELTSLVHYRCVNLRKGALLPNSPGKS